MAEIQKANPVINPELARKFAQFVMIQAQNILYVLGKIPTPEGDRLPPNLQAAKMMIDHLDLIQIKTQGNLSVQETKIISEALQQVQLAFVEASGGTPAGMMPDRSPQVDMSALDEEIGQETPTTPSPASPATNAFNPASPSDEEKKKYYKSYG
jgi:hypothetical protein